MDTPPGDQPESDPAEQVVHEAATRFLDIQISTDDTLDRQNATVIGVGSTILPVTVGLLGLSDRDIPDEAVVPLVIALGCYFVLLLCSWRGSRYRGLEYRPHLLTLLNHSDEFDLFDLKWWVTEEYIASTELNKESLEKKARWIGAANTILYAEAFLLSVAALITLL